MYMPNDATVTPDANAVLQDYVNQVQLALSKIAALESEATVATTATKLSLDSSKAAAEAASKTAGEIPTLVAQGKALVETATKTSADITPIAAQIKAVAAELTPI